MANCYYAWLWEAISNLGFLYRAWCSVLEVLDHFPHHIAPDVVREVHHVLLLSLPEGLPDEGSGRILTIK